MSKVENQPPKPKSAAELIPLPPLFWDPDSEGQKALRAPINLVWVSTRDKGGESVPLDCTPLDGLPEFPHQLAEKYPGVPFVELVARAADGQLLARVMHRCRSASAAAAPDQRAPAAPSPASATSDALGIMQAINSRTDALMGMLIQSKDAAAAQLVDAISRMSGQRIVDSQALFETLLKAKGGGAGAEQKGELAAFLKGFGHAQSLIAAGQEGGDGDDEASLEELAKVALKGWMQGKAEAAGGTPAPRPRPRAVPDPENP